MSRKKLRCALYTRKSSDEGLDQAFNSLDAQREACAAYVKSQRAEGWTALPARYDDGGFSGGSMERPGLRRLLADIARGQIDVVVVYKIDRLTRALADFARMLELFDQHQVSFVSVTQSFNTTSSMGRLTLNVLLSFAQFEREVTGERIRDKIAASKQKGLWMGGTVPLGYDLPPPDGERVLVVNAAEAETVRLIFRSYLDLGAVPDLLDRLDRQNIRSKRHVSRKGRVMGGHRFSRGALFYLLRNRIYLGEITHKGKSYPGRHKAIIDPDLFESVQRQLAAHAGRHRGQVSAEDGDNRHDPSWLTGRIHDASGQGMSPAAARGRGGRRYRYYVSHGLQQGKIRRGRGETGGQRIPAPMLEARVAAILRRFKLPGEDKAWPCLLRLEVHADHILLILDGESSEDAEQLRPHLIEGERLEEDPVRDRHLRLTHPLRLQRRQYRLEPVPDRSHPDPALIAALRRAHRHLDCDRLGLPVCDGAPETPYVRRQLRLAFLAPDLQRDILHGRQPPGLTLARLLAAEIPPGWDDQRQMIRDLAGA